MDFRSILEAAFAAVLGGEAAENKDSLAEAADGAPMRVDGRADGGEEKDGEGKEDSAGNTGEERNMTAEMDSSDETDGEERNMAAKNAGDFEKTEKDAADSLAESVSAIKKASGLIKQLRAFSLSAEHDLDLNRAKELDGVAELLTGLCEAARQNAAAKSGA